MRNITRHLPIFGALLLLVLALGACTLTTPGNKITTHPDLFGTSAAQTLVPMLTQAISSPSPTATLLAVTATPSAQPSATAQVVLAQPTATTALPATALPTATTASSTATNLGTSYSVPCDRADFVVDVTYADFTVVAPNTTFIKTWRLKNSGTCTWNSSYNLVFYAKSAMGGPAAMSLTTGTVPPGGVIDVSVTLKAPAADGTYEGDWKLANSTGKQFGIGADGSSYFWVKIIVASGTRIQMMAGATSAGTHGHVAKNGCTTYLAGALAGQYLMASINTINKPLVFEIQAPNGAYLVKASDKLTSWQGTLPVNGDYRITIVNSGDATDFDFTIIIPVRVNFRLGTTGATLTGRIGSQMINTYLLKALKDQSMTVTVQSDKGDVYLTIYGLQDGTPYVRADLAQTTFTFTLPSTQDYVVQLVSYGSVAENYTVSFQVK